jgi:hypothetical protein
MKRTILIVAALTLLGGSRGKADNFTTLDDPSGTNGTLAAGISGGNIVGYTFDSNGAVHGFLYNGTSYKTIDDPLSGPYSTIAIGISGSNVVGYYRDSNNLDHGFLYNGTSYKTLDNPLGTLGTDANGVSGNKVVVLQRQ